MATATEIKSFIKLLGGLAVLESNRRIASGKGFVLPSVCIAQSAIETGWGTAGIMTRANAFFGIKAGGSWTGAVYRADTWEVANGEAYNTTANFRAYPSLEASVRDYYDLIGNASRYANALSYGTDRTKWKSAHDCIHAIWSGGYATDTLYVEKIMNTINARDLTAYDALVTGTGVPAEGVGDYSTSGFTFTKADFVQGELVVSDSGRSISLNSGATNAVSLSWDKAPALNLTGFRLAMNGSYVQSFAILNGDSAKVIVTTLGNTTVPPGEKVGITLKKQDGSAFSVSELPNDFSLVISYDFTQYPDGNESYSTPIASFVEIETI